MAKDHSHSKEKASSPSDLPLFFKNPYPITLERHRNAGLREGAGISYAEGTNSVPLNFLEFAEAARSYPIVFSTGPEPLPVALLGLEQKNLFLDGKNQWLPGHYIPAYVRKYPFALLEAEQGAQWILCVDEGAETFAAIDPEWKFYDDGKISKASEEVLAFCTTYQQHHRLTREFAAALKEKGLLADRVSTFTHKDGHVFNLQGFSMIDEEKLASLDDATALDWRAKGWLFLIDAVLLSAVNWKYLSDRMTLDKNVPAKGPRKPKTR